MKLVWKTSLLITTLLLAGTAARAETSGAVLMKADYSEAKLLINETATAGGELQQIYRDMEVPETVTSTLRTKTFAIPRGGFGFTCSQAVSQRPQNATSCTFFIRRLPAANTPHVKTVIEKNAAGRIARIELDGESANDLDGVFRPDVKGYVTFALELPGGVKLGVYGSPYLDLEIEFRAPQK